MPGRWAGAAPGPLLGVGELAVFAVFGVGDDLQHMAGLPRIGGCGQIHGRNHGLRPLLQTLRGRQDHRHVLAGTRRSADARANAGKASSSRAVATIADPDITVDPVAAATSVAVVPAANTRESPYYIGGTGHRCGVGVQPVTDRRQDRHRPGPLLGTQHNRIREAIEQRADLIQHRRVLGGQLRADPRPPLRTPGTPRRNPSHPLPTATTLDTGVRHLPDHQQRHCGQPAGTREHGDPTAAAGNYPGLQLPFTAAR